MHSNPQVSVIVSTYNQPEWLSLVLYSYELQNIKNFEIIIADDGSDWRTKQVIYDFSVKSELKVTHVWHEDNGFQKTKILNKAISATNADYLIFTDGDCIARQDFVKSHFNLRRQNTVLSGGYFKLNKSVSKYITNDTILTEKCFNKNWLLEHGQPKSFKFNKLTTSILKANLLNTLTPTKATFDGMNVSCYKADIVAVNGFDERMQYGGEDREVGERMMHNGVSFLQVRYSCICVHLHHDRPYKDGETLRFNKQIRNQTKKYKKTYTKFGIKNQL